MAYSEPEFRTGPSHLPQLDGVRGLAVLMVMVFHFFQSVPDQFRGLAFMGALTRASIWGQTGVDLFFVLSGFLITRILINAKTHEGYFQNFYARRILRIFPLYYGFLIYFYFVAPHLGLVDVVPLSRQAPFWVYLQNIGISSQSGPGHFWSLAVEEHFYLFWPFLIYFLDLKNAVRALLGIIAVAVLTRAVFVALDRQVFFFTLTRIDALSMGALLAIAETRGLEHAQRVLVRILLVVFPVLAMMWVFTSGTGNPILQVAKFSVIALIYTALIGIASTSRGVLRKLLTLKPLTYTGKISYGMYVLHPTCFALAFKYASYMSVTMLGVACLAVTLILASLVYYLYEVPFLRLKKHFEYRKLPVAVAA